MTIQELLDTNILEQLGLEKLSEAQKKEFLQKATQYILEQAISRVANELPKETREQFFAVFKEGTSDTARWEFINNHIPHFEEIILEELLNFKTEAMDVAQNIKHGA